MGEGYVRLTERGWGVCEGRWEWEEGKGWRQGWPPKVKATSNLNAGGGGDGDGGGLAA